tara:strand:- start:49 stop:252 length:204 start_codon:yes stop_codon:yes gene_type:complete
MTEVVIINTLTGDVVERSQTDAEKSQTVADIAEIKAQDKAAAAKAKARQIVLDRLGITADEAQLLLG